MMESPVSVCPVPHEQQPINEYEGLKESWFFSYGTLDWQRYLIKVFWLWGLSWFIAGPVAAVSFPPQKYPAQFFLAGAGGASIGVALALLQLYLSWSYISNRLMSPTIFYEESGWYDGQTWKKPPELLARDRLIVTYQVQPILRRLLRSFALLALLLLLGLLVWNVL